MDTNSTPIDTSSPIACPHCGKMFRLPDGFTQSNSLACPHCNQEVTGEQVLDTLVPTAEIIGTTAEEVSVDSGEAKRSYLVDEQDFTIPKPLKTATRRRGRSSVPPRKRKSSKKKSEPKNEFLRIILGALLAIPIAQIVLWWVFALDPLNLAAPTSRYAPFIVPYKLQPPDDEEQAEEKGDLDMPETQNMNDSRVPYNVIPN